MLRNFDSIITDLNGNPIKGMNGDATIKEVVVQCLIFSNDAETRALSFEEKEKRYGLAKRINVGGDVDLSVDELALIKALVGKYLGVLEVGQISPVLEGKEQ